MKVRQVHSFRFFSVFFFSFFVFLLFLHAHLSTFPAARAGFMIQFESRRIVPPSETNA